MKYLLLSISLFFLAHAPNSYAVCDDNYLANITCNGKYNNKRIDAHTLKNILNQHSEWLVEWEKAGENPDLLNNEKRANLCGADLRGVKNLLVKKNLKRADLKKTNLYQVDLRGANLQRASLDGANLYNAKLHKTNLNSAYLQYANLRLAELIEADLSQAHLNCAKLSGKGNGGEDTDYDHAVLHKANLSHAILDDADLSYADLFLANLTKASLHNTNLFKTNLTNTTLKDAFFYKANLNQTIYFPLTSSLPDIISLQRAKNFELIEGYDKDVGAPSLAELRSAYRQASIHNMADLITSMIRKGEQNANIKSNRIWGYVSWVLFDITSNYGYEKPKPLIILLCIIIGFAMFYWLFLAFSPKARNSIYIKYTDYKSIGSKSIEKKENIISFSRLYHPSHHKKTIKYLINKRLICFSLYLSFTASFRIGWQNQDYGNWSIQYLSQLLQKRSYEIDINKTWLRVFYGIQSLVSLYLFILWIMIFFWTPFG